MATTVLGHTLVEADGNEHVCTVCSVRAVCLPDNDHGDGTAVAWWTVHGYALTPCRTVNTDCLAECNGSHETHPWHDALGDIATYGGTLTSPPVLLGVVGHANLTFPSIVAAGQWVARNRVSGTATMHAHSGNFSRPCHVVLTWTLTD